MKDLMPTGQVETYEAKVTPSVALPYGLENPPSVERDSGGGLGLSEWRKIQVKDLGEIVTGNTPSTRRRDYYDGDYNLISPADLDNGKYIRTAHKRLTKLGFEQCRALPKRSVLVGCIGNVGKLGMVGNDESATNQQINALICNSEHDPEFVYYCFYINREKLKTCAVKTTVPILNKTNFSNFEVNVPPLPEQKKIAHILSTVQRAIETQDRIIQTTTELKKALMHKLFTEGLRNEPLKQTEIGLVPESWAVVRVDSVFEIQQGKQVSKKNREGNNQHSFLRTKNVFWNRLDLSELDKMNFSEVEEKRLELRPGDLLTCEGGDIGRTALWNGEVQNCYYQNHLHRLRSKNGRVDPKFGVYWFYYAFNEAKIYFGRGNITTIPNLSQSKLAELPMVLPSRSEQKDIVTILNAVGNRSEAAEHKKEQLQNLFRTLLHELMNANKRVNQLIFNTESIT